MGAGSIGEDIVFMGSLIDCVTEQVGDQRHHIRIVIDETRRRVDSEGSRPPIPK